MTRAGSDDDGCSFTHSMGPPLPQKMMSLGTGAALAAAGALVAMMAPAAVNAAEGSGVVNAIMDLGLTIPGAWLIARIWSRYS